MQQVQANQETATTPPQAAARAGAAPGDQQPLRFLLLRQKAGDLPWLVRALLRYMAPAQVVPVIGMANALWRLSRERFDAVLLDVQVSDRARARALSRAHRRCGRGSGAASVRRRGRGERGRATAAFAP